MEAAALFSSEQSKFAVMILLLTNSHDITTDILMPYLTAREAVFRFNIDLWRDYHWRINADGYELSDPTGRSCREDQVGAVYERKVMFDPPTIDVPAFGSQESWLREEVFAIWAGIKDLAMGAGKLALIHPSPTGNWYKMRQMRLARKYFPVLPWEMLHGVAPQLGDSVVCKANTGAPMGSKHCFNVNRVDPKRIDTSFPWFLQVAGEAESEVTVAYIAGRVFASQMKRTGLRHTDSRQATVTGEATWEPCELSEEESRAVCELMGETGLSFARLDFLRTAQGLTFLELNPNGQFAWMDLQDKRGMLSAIVDEIMRVHTKNLPPINP